MISSGPSDLHLLRELNAYLLTHSHSFLCALRSVNSGYLGGKKWRWQLRCHRPINLFLHDDHLANLMIFFRSFWAPLYKFQAATESGFRTRLRRRFVVPLYFDKSEFHHSILSVFSHNTYDRLDWSLISSIPSMDLMCLSEIVPWTLSAYFCHSTSLPRIPKCSDCLLRNP